MSPEDKKLFPGQVDPADDPVNHPAHYTSHPSGIECIEITEHFNFCQGNAIKYIWRAGLKGENPDEQGIEDLKKAVWYLEREIERFEKAFIPADHPQVRVSGVPYSVERREIQKAASKMKLTDEY